VLKNFKNLNLGLYERLKMKFHRINLFFGDNRRVDVLIRWFIEVENWDSCGAENHSAPG